MKTRLLLLLTTLWATLAPALTTVNFSARTVDNKPVTNCLIAITALNPVVSDGTTNLILGRTLTIRTGTNGSVTTNLVPQLYLVQYRSAIPFFQANLTNNVPDTHVTVNANDLITVSTNPVSSTMAYSQAQSDARFVARSFGIGTNLVFKDTNGAPFAGYVWVALDTNGSGGWRTNVPASGAGDVLSTDFLTASNFLFTTITNYDAVSSNFLWTNLHARILSSSNGTHAILLTASNGVWLASSNLTGDATNTLASDLAARIVAATNGLNSARQTILDASNSIYLTRMTTIEGSISGFVSVDAINSIDEPNFALQSFTTSELWTIDDSAGYNGATNPELISRIGATETLTGKTLTSPTINGGTINGGTQNSPEINSADINGGTIAGATLTTPDFGTGIVGATNINPSVLVRDPNDITTSILRMTPIGGGTMATQVFRIWHSHGGGAAGAIRDWNFGRFYADTETYSDDTNTIAQLRDINAASNSLYTALSSGSGGSGITFTNATALYVDNLTTGIVFKAQSVLITNAGARLGVGTNAPGYTLDVMGIVNARGLKVGNVNLTNSNSDLRIGVDGVANFFRLLPFNGDVYFGNTGAGDLIFRNSEDTGQEKARFTAAGMLNMTGGVRVASAILTNTLQVNGITIYKSNTVTAAAVAAAITNGDFGSIVISNGLHHFWMSNNVMGWKLAAP